MNEDIKKIEGKNELEELLEFMINLDLNIGSCDTFHENEERKKALIEDMELFYWPIMRKINELLGLPNNFDG